MIEHMESRMLFSSTPHAALLVLRAEVAGIHQVMYNMILANQSAIANLNHDVSIFPATAASDNDSLRQLNFQFNSQLSQLKTDYNEVKTLFNEDITQLINTCNTYNRHPTASAGLAVVASQQLLSSQAAAASAAIATDSSQMHFAYQQALQALASAHPLDSTYESRISHISTAFSNNIAAIETIAGTEITGTAIPNFITALEPDGVLAAA